MRICQSRYADEGPSTDVEERLQAVGSKCGFTELFAGWWRKMWVHWR
jgi:hypothetical protein